MSIKGILLIQLAFLKFIFRAAYPLPILLGQKDSIIKYYEYIFITSVA